MSGFSTSWLALREPVDLRSRSGAIADAVQSRFMTRDALRIVDLGCGTGANLRGTAPLLPLKQSWTLVDHDAGLLTAARAELTAWAEASHDDGGVLHLKKGRQSIDVAFRRLDLAGELDRIFDADPQLVTAAAFFDLASSEFIRAFARMIAERRSAFLTVLTYNGISQWKPRHPLDQTIISAFHRHQASDKGFGPACGPTAAAHLSDQFKINDYLVSEGDSPWVLTEDKCKDLIADLRIGHVKAAVETGLVDQAQADTWAKAKRSEVVIGHTDTFAVPA